MKLLFCKKCQDIVKLRQEDITMCYCGDTYGQYTDELNAWYSGDDCVPLGFANSTLSIALQNQPESGMGFNFTAFVIPKECDTFKKIDE